MSDHKHLSHELCFAQYTHVKVVADSENSENDAHKHEI